MKSTITYCTNCNHIMDISHSFCPNCGTPIDELSNLTTSLHVKENRIYDDDDNILFGFKWISGWRIPHIKGRIYDPITPKVAQEVFDSSGNHIAKIKQGTTPLLNNKFDFTLFDKHIGSLKEGGIGDKFSYSFDYKNWLLYPDKQFQYSVVENDHIIMTVNRNILHINEIAKENLIYLILIFVTLY